MFNQKPDQNETLAEPAGLQQLLQPLPVDDHEASCLKHMGRSLFADQDPGGMVVVPAAGMGLDIGMFIQFPDL